MDKVRPRSDCDHRLRVAFEGFPLLGGGILKEVPVPRVVAPCHEQVYEGDVILHSLVGGVRQEVIRGGKSPQRDHFSVQPEAPGEPDGPPAIQPPVP